MILGFLNPFSFHSFSSHHQTLELTNHPISYSVLKLFTGLAMAALVT